MTCREFKHNAASLGLWELAQPQDENAQLLGHAETCRSCGAWLEKQRTLAASMHALRARTAGREAGPDVERALLRVFRQGIPVAVGASLATAEVAVGRQEPVLTEMTGPSETLRPHSHSKAAPASTPIAWRLSRWFEIGAYAAVAAALLIAIFLGIHLLQRGSKVAPVQSQAPAQVVPAIQQPVTIASGLGKVPALRPERREGPATQGRVIATPKQSRQQAPTPSKESAGTAVEASSEEPAGDADAGYTALMICDPLSCSSDAQVVRMELPSQGAQPQVADIVVGYDGVVRAVRFVN